MGQSLRKPALKTFDPEDSRRSTLWDPETREGGAEVPLGTASWVLPLESNDTHSLDSHDESEFCSEAKHCHIWEHAK